MTRLAFRSFIAAALLCVACASARAEVRVALVIGNSAYQNVPRLVNPVNDANDVAAALKRDGFDTIVATDLDKDHMDEATIKFAKAARTADVAMFYYSGHALQFAGINYLAPVDAKLADEADLRRFVRVDEIVSDLQQAKNLRILVLDACRDNPLADELRRSIGATRALPLQRGLAKIDTPLGMIVSYSTQAGTDADDGNGRNSPYTAAFLKEIEKRDEIGTIFRRISADVYEDTGHRQLPELSLSLIGEFYLLGNPPTVPQAAADGASRVAPAAEPPNNIHTSLVTTDRPNDQMNLDDLHRNWTIAPKNAMPIRSVGFEINGRLAISTDADGTVRRWNIEKGALDQTIPSKYTVGSSVVFPLSPLTASSEGNDIHLVDITTAKSKVLHLQAFVSAIAPSVADDVISGDWSGNVAIWDGTSDRLVRRFAAHTGRVRSVAISSDTHLIATGGEDQLVKIWDERTGRLIRSCPLASGWIWSISFSPNGHHLAVANTKTGVIDILSSSNCASELSLHGHSGAVLSVVFSRDGRTIVSGGNDGTVRTWNAETGAAMSTFRGHSARVNAVAISPDNRTIVSASDDGTLRVWDTSNERLAETLISLGVSSYALLRADGSFWTDAASYPLLQLVRGADTMSMPAEFRAKFLRSEPYALSTSTPN